MTPSRAPITLTGPEALTFSQVAERLSSHLGHRVDYIDAPPLDWRAALIQAGLTPWYAEALVEIFGDYGRRPPIPVSPATRQILGRPARSIDDFIREQLLPALHATTPTG